MALVGDGRGEAWRRRLVAGALTMGLAVAAAACSSGSSATPLAVKAGGGSAPTSSGAPSPAASAGSSTPSVAPASPSSSAGAAPAASSTSTTHSTHSAAPSTAATSHPSPVPTAPPATQAPAVTRSGPAPTAPGTYTFALQGSGSTTFQTSQGSYSLPAQAQTTLTITQSGSTEQWTNSVSSMNLTFASNGVFLTSETLVGPGTTCTFQPALALPPWPVATGKSASATAACGGSTLQVVVQVLGGSGGNYTVKTTQSLGATLTVVETDTYSVARRMPVATSFKINGSYGGASFTTNSSYVLSS